MIRLLALLLLLSIGPSPSAKVDGYPSVVYSVRRVSLQALGFAFEIRFVEKIEVVMPRRKSEKRP